MKHVVGLVGEKGSGKGKFTELFKQYVKDYSISSARFSDVLNDILKLLYIPPSRENLQKLVLNLKNAFGPDVLTNAIYNRMLNEQSDIIILDGVRWPTDEEMVKKLPNSFLVYITADANIRYERTKIRGEKVGEDKTTFEQFLKEEQVETEIFIPQIGKRADVKINNDGTLAEFKKQVKKFRVQYFKSFV